MSRRPSPDPQAVLLGIATYIAIAGWLIVAPLAGLLFSFFAGTGPPSGSLTAGSLSRDIIAVLVFSVSGYVTGRTSWSSPILDGAILGVALYALVTLFNRTLWAMFDLAVPVDVLAELGSLSRAVVAALVGGTGAQWHMRLRGARRIGFGDLSRRAQIALGLVAIAPFAFLALTYRP
jgi:hypothetical protein